VRQKTASAVVLALLLAGAGCAGRVATSPAEVTPAAVPKSGTAQPSPPSKAPAPAPPVTGTGSQSSQGAPVAAAPTPSSNAGRASAPAGEAPPATASTYVFSPQQAVTAAPAPSQPSAPQGDVPAPPASPEVAETGTDPKPEAGAPPAPSAGVLQLLVVASPAQVAPGEVVTVDVIAQSSTAVIDAPLHLTFDPNVVEFVDGAPGDFLTQGGSSVVFLADGRSVPGDVALAVGRITREQGASGSGLLCRVRFRGVRAGSSPVLVGQAKAWGAAGEQLTVLSAGTAVAVR